VGVLVAEIINEVTIKAHLAAPKHVGIPTQTGDVRPVWLTIHYLLANPFSSPRGATGLDGIPLV
jgi:hypothetical protein